MTPIGKLVDIFCFLILALIIGASCLILLPTIKIQSDFSISAILVLNVYWERSVKGILHPSCLDSILLIFKSSDNFLNKKEHDYLSIVIETASKEKIITFEKINFYKIILDETIINTRIWNLASYISYVVG